MVAVRDVVKVRRISPTGATRRAGRAGLPGAQQAVAEGPVRAHRAVRGGRGAVAVAGACSVAPAVRVAMHTGRNDIVRIHRRRARAAGYVGAVFRAVVGRAGDGALVVANVISLRDTAGDEVRALVQFSWRIERSKRQRKRWKQKRGRRWTSDESYESN